MSRNAIAFFFKKHGIPQSYSNAVFLSTAGALGSHGALHIFYLLQNRATVSCTGSILLEPSGVAIFCFPFKNANP